jgi:hypothetical protein
MIREGILVFVIVTARETAATVRNGKIAIVAATRHGMQKGASRSHANTQLLGGRGVTRPGSLLRVPWGLSASGVVALVRQHDV